MNKGRYIYCHGRSADILENKRRYFYGASFNGVACCRPMTRPTPAPPMRSNMPKPANARNAKRPMPSAPDNRPTPDAADVLARVYALILSWPTTEEKRAGQEGSNPT